MAPVAVLAQVAPEALGDLVVTATREPKPGFEVPAAIDSVDARVLREDRPQVNLSEALGRVPGLVVQNRQNYAQDLQVVSRGFGGRSTFGVRGVRLIADGIPATMPDGQGQAASFSLATADRIEVLRGPFASLYGNASGGVVQSFTADGPPDPTVTAAGYAGSYGTWKLGTMVGGQAGALNYLAEGSRFHTDGYRQHSAATRDQLNARFTLPAAGGKLAIVANGLDQRDTQDPLGLTRAQLEADPRQVDPAAILFDTRKSIRQSQLGAVHELPVSDRDRLQARLYGGNRQVVQFLGQTGDTPRGSGGVVDLDRTYGGAGLRWTRSVAASAGVATLSGGVEHDRLDERRRGYVNDFGKPGALRRDEDDRVASTDVFVQAEWPLAPAWVLSGGARHSRVAFESRDYYVVGINPDDSGSLSYAHTSPVAGVLFRADERWNLYVNAGGGFETPTFAELAYRPGGATGLNFDLRPATSRHWEAGAKGRIGNRGRLTAAVFRIDTKDEIVVNSSVGGRTDYKNASRTRRDGIEIGLETAPAPGFELAASATWLDARFRDAFTAGTPVVPVPAGSRLPGVAPVALYGELVWRPAGTGLHAAVEVRHAGRLWVNDANTDFAAASTVLNLRAGLEQRPGGWVVREFVRVDNVADRAYAGSVIVAESRGRYFEPAPGRNVLVGVTASLSF